MRIRSLCLALAIVLLVVCNSFAFADDALRKKLGQLFIVGFIGPVVTDSLFADLSERNIGGVYLSYINGNLESPTQIQQLTAQIRSAAQTPPFICADQEGGRVARLDARNGFASTYSAYTLGMIFKSLDSTRAEATLMASWMTQCGFNLNLAPVVDVAPTPYDSARYAGRLYSTDPMVVTAHAQTFIEQFQDATVMTTLKHFPGSGTSTDMTPYARLLESNRVDMIMVGHNRVPQIDNVYLTSLSAAAVQGLLRGSMGYDGVVITDDLFRMITASLYGYGQAARLALNAGNDVLLYVGNTANNCSLVRQIVDTLEVDVQQGRIAMSRVDEAYSRIMQLKNRYKVTSASSPFASRSIAPDAFHLSNYPNPFNPTTVIRYQLSGASDVKLVIYDVLGREISELVNERQEAGVHEVRFSAKGGSASGGDGSNLASGVYFCRLSVSPLARRDLVTRERDGEAGNFVQVRKLLLIR